MAEPDTGMLTEGQEREPVSSAGIPGADPGAALEGVAAARQQPSGTADSGGQRAAEEAAPREVEAGTASGPDPAVPSRGAVDENRPADVVAQAGLAGMTGPHIQPNVLQRQHAAAPHGHPETAGEDLVEPASGPAQEGKKDV